MVRNGHARQRQVTTAAGAVPVRARRVDDRRTDLVSGGRVRFRSQILPSWCRKRPKVTEVVALLYRHGLSTGDLVSALAAFFGSAAGLSAAADVGRLLAGWQADDQVFCRRDLAGRDDVDGWADGVQFRVRLEQARLCCLVLVGVGADGTRSWLPWLTGSGNPPTAGPRCWAAFGAVGWGRRWWRSGRRAWLWAALREVFPATRQQRDGVHSSPTCWAAARQRARRGAEGAG